MVAGDELPSVQSCENSCFGARLGQAEGHAWAWPKDLVQGAEGDDQHQHDGQRRQHQLHTVGRVIGTQR